MEDHCTSVTIVVGVHFICNDLKVLFFLEILTPCNLVRKFCAADWSNLCQIWVKLYLCGYHTVLLRANVQLHILNKFSVIPTGNKNYWEMTGPVK